MMPLRITIGAVTGGLVGLALHFLISPAIGGKCIILCRPERATLAGLLIGGLIALAYARSEGKKASGNAGPQDPPAGGAR
jgi:hypothetical protein